MSSSTRRKISSRACDGCKIRKVRCSEAPPCTRCESIGIECTFKKRQATRGPRSLRAKTMAEIRSLQESQGPTPWADSGSPAGSSGPPPPPPPDVRQQQQQSSCGENTGSGTERRKTPVSSLIVRLCLYNHRLFPVWPIIAAEDIIGALLRDPADVETYALANAVCAAIIAQLKLPFEGRTDDNDPVTAASMAAECQRAKTSLADADGGPEMNLNMLRISFFQHIYHENLSPGGSKSLLFLREAITTAQIMGLHRRSSYAYLAAAEQQMRRRIIWLLFVTERGVAMLHKLPTVLTWQRSFPAPSGGSLDCEQDEAHILPAFRKLLDLFWMLDQGGAFDLIHADDSGDAQQRSRLEYLQRRLQETSSEEHEVNEVQKADILVTKSWMQTVLWRASTRRSRVALLPEQTGHVVQPYRIANEFLSSISRYSKKALEAHGPTIELKIYEIASALTDTLATNMDRLPTSVGIQVRPVELLVQLQRLLASSRGGNKTLLTLLCARIAEVERSSPSSPPDPPPAEADDDDNNNNNKDMEDTGGLFDMRDDGARKRVSYPTSYADMARLDCSLELQAWPEPSLSASVDACGNLGMMFTQVADEPWNGWAIDLSGVS